MNQMSIIYQTSKLAMKSKFVLRAWSSTAILSNLQRTLDDLKPLIGTQVKMPTLEFKSPIKVAGNL